MARDTPRRRNPFGIWSPQPKSSMVLAWRSLLSLRAEPWHWQNNPYDALWWVVDATGPLEPEVGSMLKDKGPIQGVLLARSFVELIDPSWIFFKTPFKSTYVNRWLDQRCEQVVGQLHVVPDREAGKRTLLQVQGRRFHLHRWPNLTRYKVHSLALTSTCIKLLAGHQTYEALLLTCPDRVLLDRLLIDCLADQILVYDMPDLPGLLNQAPPSVHPLLQWLRKRFL